MSDCGHDPLMIQALADGELDAVHAAEIERRIGACPDCAALHAEILALRDALATDGMRVAAPDRLKRRIAESLAAAAPAEAMPRMTRRPRHWAWLGAGAGVAAAASIGLFAVVGAFQEDVALTADLVGGHVRSLQASHLVDVETSDHHVVKPWFDGRLTFSPPVIDLKDQGFPLVGGRLDYVAGRPAAAVVYRRGRHLINLFVWPDASAGGLERSTEADGYAVRRWRAHGMAFAAVSDVNPADLALFETDLKASGG
ncbi:anti-sigma factor family protein [Phenylobacterium montanum]|uniref:Anti-sigma factor n=1 Tax=Phenylobacterium montanum TaxID=2823693 RepID=A0A975FYA0_9CAUL|nr:anti-sigma factor [Caulobacter sp. S6]QUD87068.1 anti-sigma factor [Caulobacter sp. S6]